MSDTATSIDDNGGPSTARVIRLDHVQLAMPAGGEPVARRFYSATLGLAEVAKPAPLAARGGCWFESGPDISGVKIHLGVEAEFRPARKAHPALVVADLDGLLAAIVASWPTRPVWSEEIPGTRRCHIDDPFGNRIELIESPA